MSNSSVSPQKLANAIRALAMDSIQKAKSGHPGMPLGMADIAVALWTRHLRHNPKDPKWLGRDRFILSNGHGSMLQYALLHLTGYDLSMDDLKSFRQLHSRTPGHPEVGVTPGVETSTGPLGQGIANGIGMALAEKMLAAEFNRPGFPVIDNRTYVFLGDGCLMEGVSHEACSLAGVWQLGKLVAFYDDNGISIDGNVGGSRPGITDMSTLGQPGDFAMFLAENADASPWPSFHTEYGFLPERNVVTVAAVEGYSGIMGIGYSRPEYLDLIAAWLRGHDRPYRRSIILLVAQDTAQMLAREGWTREAMRQYIRERARIPFGEWNRQYHGAKEARKGVPEEVFSIADPNELVDKPFFDSMPIIVAGGTGEKSMLLPCWASGKMVSQEIRLPASWGEGVR